MVPLEFSSELDHVGALIVLTIREVLVRLNTLDIPPPLPGVLPSQKLRAPISLVYRPEMLAQVVISAQNGSAPGHCAQEPHALPMIASSTHVSSQVRGTVARRAGEDSRAEGAAHHTARQRRYTLASV